MERVVGALDLPPWLTGVGLEGAVLACGEDAWEAFTGFAAVFVAGCAFLAAAGAGFFAGFAAVLPAALLLTAAGAGFFTGFAAALALAAGLEEALPPPLFT